MRVWARRCHEIVVRVLPRAQLLENADTRAALPRVWAHSLGRQRTTADKTTSRPNTQPGLPSNHHLWKLPRSEPSPRRSAARWRSMYPPRTPPRTSARRRSMPSPAPRVPPQTPGENADTRAALPRVWAHSLGRQRTTAEKTTSRPNTQPGLPSNHHLWKLPRSEPSPRRSAARWRSMCPSPARASTNICAFAFDVPIPTNGGPSPEGAVRSRPDQDPRRDRG
jgi:hypothetical protein